MALRAKKPTTIEKRLKMLIYGAAGVGKTTAAIQFPKPYLIDTERGAENDQYVKLLEKQGGVIFQTTDFDEILEEIKALLVEKHEYKTLIIDPITTVYNNELDKSALLLASKDDPAGTAYGRHKQVPDRKMKRLFNLLLRLDMNVILTSHSKAEWKNKEATGKDTYDFLIKSDFLFDLIIEAQERGSERVAITRKTRIETFPKNESFNFSYQNFSEKYGVKLLEKDSIAQSLATKEQITQFKHLVELLKVDQSIVEKWLEKANASTIDEMETSKIQTCINFLLDKVSTTSSQTNEERKAA